VDLGRLFTQLRSKIFSTAANCERAARHPSLVGRRRRDTSYSRQSAHRSDEGSSCGIAWGWPCACHHQRPPPRGM